MTTEQAGQARLENGQQQRPEQDEQRESQQRVPPQQLSARPPQNSKGTMSFIFGLISVVLCVTFFFSSLLALAGLLLGIEQRGLLRQGEATNRSMTNAGVVLSAIGLILSIGVPMIIMMIFGSDFYRLN